MRTLWSGANPPLPSPSRTVASTRASKTQPSGEGGDEHLPGVGDRPRVVEDHPQ